jgi:cytochrome b involved in lipid metabolism
MRRLFLVSTALFWLAVFGFWLAAMLAPAQTPAVAAAKAFTLADVAKHKSKDDCWMAIGAQVYDFTAYVSQHPADPSVFLPWCGKEATEANKTKTKGRPHSPYADQLLPTYRIGVLKDTH